MQETITLQDIHDFLDKLQLFVPNIGEYEYHSSNEHFQFLIKTTNHSLKIPMEQLVANRQKKLTQEDYQLIAATLYPENAVKPTPIKTPQPSVYEKRVDAGYKVFRNLLILLLILAGAGLGIYALVDYTDHSLQRVHDAYSQHQLETLEDEYVEEPKTEEELKQELYDKECENPPAYLTGSISYTPIYKNLLSMKVVGLKMKGELINKATLAKFKNIKIKVRFLSNTGAVLFTKNFVVYEYVEARSSTKFVQEIEVTNQEYQDIENFKWEIVSGEY